MPQTNITYDHTIDGYAAFKDGVFKLAVITTKQNQGLVRNGVVLYEALPRTSWTIHFTSPVLHVDDVTAILSSLPTEA